MNLATDKILAQVTPQSLSPAALTSIDADAHDTAMAAAVRTNPFVIVSTSAWNICISVENVVGLTAPRERRNPLAPPVRDLAVDTRLVVA